MRGASLRKREFFFAFLHDRSPQTHSLPLLHGGKKATLLFLPASEHTQPHVWLVQLL